MTDKEYVLHTMRKYGKNAAQTIQAAIPDLTGTEIIEQEVFLPTFNSQKQYLGYKVGYVCVAPSGRVVKLLQPYDSLIYPQEPEELASQWGYYWSTDPSKALPFFKSATSPYNVGECCTENGKVYRSVLLTPNVYSPSEYPAGWEVVN